MLHQLRLFACSAENLDFVRVSERYMGKEKSKENNR